MAIRVIREIGDDILEKQCKAVPKMTLRTKILIGDMLETMYESNGVGLAAPQVGVLKRIVVIDVGEGPIVLINPQIIESSGEKTGEEGCLSVPGKFGIVTRPDRVKVRAFDETSSKWKAKACLQGRFVMNLIIWTENCMLNWQKTDFMKCLMMKKIKTMRKEGKNENHIYGNTRFFSRNTGSACGSGA